MAAYMTKKSALGLLKEAFARNGYVRCKSLSRWVDEGSNAYKKGYEVRLIANSDVELKALHLALLKWKFTPGRAFAKTHQQALPLYGRVAVERFLLLVGADSERIEHVVETARLRRKPDQCSIPDKNSSDKPLHGRANHKEAAT